MTEEWLKSYGFLFDLDTTVVSGIGEMVEILGQGQELRKQREALGLTQQQVAKRANMDIRQYQRLESGERSMLSTSLRIGLNICYALQIDPMYYCEAKLIHKPEKMSDDNAQPVQPEMPHGRRKYVIYRSDEEGTLGEIVGVEYGMEVDSAFNQICDAIRVDLLESPEYAGCGVDVYPYEKDSEDGYSIHAAVLPPCAVKNILCFYAIREYKE